MAELFRYAAFISYSSKDAAFAGLDERATRSRDTSVWWTKGVEWPATATNFKAQRAVERTKTDPFTLLEHWR